jgi:hypothetical protein
MGIQSEQRPGGADCRAGGSDRSATPGRHDDDASPLARWKALSVTGLEADLAYFQARLELIGQPATCNQKAQVETFRFLSQAMESILARLHRKPTEA